MEPESDEEKVGDKDKKDDDKKDADKKDNDKKKEGDKDKDKEKKEEPAKTVIDLDGIEQRIVSLPVKSANYVGLDVGKAGTLFVSELPDVPRFEQATPQVTVSKFDLTTRKTEPFLSGVTSFAVSANGEKVLYKQGQGWFIAGTGAAPKAGEGTLNIGAMEVHVDPRVEWNQMYREVWRIQRDFLYDPGHHGLDLAAAQKKYEPYLKGLGGRADLNYLFDEMLGEITIGHMFIRGGDVPAAAEGKGWSAGSGLQDRKRTLPIRAGFQRRKLESRFASATDAAGCRCKDRGLFAGGEWRGRAAAGRRQQVSGKYGGPAGAD